MKICNKCKKNKKESEFHKNGKNGLLAQCIECRKKQMRTPEQKKKNNEYTKKWWKNVKPEVRERRMIRNRLYYKRVRAEVIKKYGGKCVCCGEKEDAFLTLDHVNNDGNIHRKRLGAGKGGSTLKIYEWARKNNYPKTLQILCYNCNMAKAKLGQCPHQKNEK